ncbi:MAG TPA: hypothetical protein VD908_06400 [Cytophagales bacterium]|nr:hypothetical protein [Cytophagales bacterium]
MKTNNRELTKVYAPPSHPGFLGSGHIARPVIQVDYKDSDPFITLMDDMLNPPVGLIHMVDLKPLASFWKEKWVRKSMD